MSLEIRSLPIYKISATGNDFLLVDLLTSENVAAWAPIFAKPSRVQCTRDWCNRHEGIGADGLVVLETAPPPHAFAWDFYNSDGGSAEMCGNAARAVSLYFKNFHGGDRFTFATRAGDVSAVVDSAVNIAVTLPAIAQNEWGLHASGSSLAYDFVRAGVPHAVHVVSDIDDRAALRALAHLLKLEPRFVAAGVNVTFVQRVSAERIKSVTYERGVEDFTLACGTGAIAAAFTQTRGAENRAIEVQVPGGRLSVLWKDGRPQLIGPAKIIAAIHITA